MAAADRSPGFRAVAVLALALLANAALGLPAMARPPDPCTLLSLAEVRELESAAARAIASDPAVDAEQSACAWLDGEDNMVLMISLAPATKASIKEALDAEGFLLESSRIVPLEGVGDEAAAVFDKVSAFSDAPDYLAGIVARRGAWQVFIVCDLKIPDETSPQFAALRAKLELAVRRL